MGLQITLKLFLHFPSFPKISRASIRQKAWIRRIIFLIVCHFCLDQTCLFLMASML
jgi:hypothetical protein